MSRAASRVRPSNARSARAESERTAPSYPPHYTPLPPHATWARSRRKPTRARAIRVGVVIALTLLIGVPAGFYLARAAVETRVESTVSEFHAAVIRGDFPAAHALTCGSASTMVEELAANADIAAAGGDVAESGLGGSIAVERIEWRALGAPVIYYRLDGRGAVSTNRIGKLENVGGRWELCEDFAAG